MVQSTHRPRLIPKTTIVASVVIVVLVATAAASAYLVSRSRLVKVPDVVGVPLDTAEARFLDADLALRNAGTQVSVDVPSGSVISQSPIAGRSVRAGTSIDVIVSAGPQTFVIPDLIGEPVDQARETLTALGFKVVVKTVSSETSDAIVLEMYPAPGVLASLGDEIRLTVPGVVDPAQALLPYDLHGVLVLLDPQAPPDGSSVDVPLEVGRRVRALLEAAGAGVSTTRSASGVGATAEERRAAAEGSAATVLVGIAVSADARAGIVVSYADSGGHSAESLEYAKAITRATVLPGLTVNESAASGDPVMAVFPGAAVTVSVGSSNAPEDLQRFADPNWADQVARAIYRGIGSVASAE